ncbi:MAG: acyl--CoA ligase [Burkholderiales bacterium]|nr:acyl--CoA ligase [Burkholderiales bacterium]
MTAVLLHGAFERACARLPRKVALVCRSGRVSYADLGARVRVMARRMRAAGVRPGDRVLLALESDAPYAAAVHAVLACGGVFVPLTPTTRPERLAFIAQDTEAAAMWVEARFTADDEHALHERCPALRAVLRAGLPGGAGEPGEEGPGGVAAPCADQDLAAILYTSGSTGRPKGVMLTHHNMLSAWRSVQAYLGLREDDVIGLALPPTFSYGLYHLLMGLGLGATVVLEHQVAFALKVAQTIERERVTVFPGVPTLLSALLGLPQLAQFDHAALRLVSNAAAALPQALVPRIRAAWPRAQLFSMYGMTECKRISYLPPEEVERRPGSVGRGMPHQEHWLADEAGRRLPPGSTGELVVRGEHVMRGYWRRPAETAERLRPGPLEGERVLHTGDLFRSDDEGYLYFVARMDDIIKSRGEKVAPREVEEAIHQVPGVVACAVVGVPDPLLGQAVKAFVTLAPGAATSARDIVRHCQATLESYMVPKQVDLVDELPVTESGKVRHAALRGAP